MSDWIDRFVFFDELTDEERSTLDEALEGRAEVEAAFAEWKRLRLAIRTRLDAAVEDRTFLIHYTLWRSGRTSQLTPEEVAEVEQALPEFERQLEATSSLQAILDCIEDEIADFESVWDQSISGQGTNKTDARPSVPRRRRSDTTSMTRQAWPVAAVVAILALGAVLVGFLREEQSTMVVETMGDEVRSVVLDDGSIVRLVSDARLEYRRPGKDEAFDRRVKLRGRALFRVRPGDDMFVVETPAAITTVWGTTFGLDSDESFTEVVLAEGRVSVVSRRDSQRPVVLDPGEMTRVVGSRDPTAPVAVDVADALAWTRLFVFREDVVERIASRLSRHYGVPVAVDAELQHETVTGTFEQDWAIEYILQTLARTLDADLTGSPTEGYVLRAESETISSRE